MKNVSDDRIALIVFLFKQLFIVATLIPLRYVYAIDCLIHFQNTNTSIHPYRLKKERGQVGFFQ